MLLRTKLTGVFAAVLALMGLTSCDALYRSPDKSIYHVGDSITMSAQWHNDKVWASKVPAGYSYEVDSFMGQKVEDHLDKVAEYGRNGIPERLVIAVGSNDASAGWPEQSKRNYIEMVSSTPDRTCIVSVLPYRDPEAASPPTAAKAAAFEKARSDIRDIVATSGRTHVFADYKEFVDEFKAAGMISSDGLHLNTDTDDSAFNQRVKDTYRDWVFRHINTCEGDRL